MASTPNTKVGPARRVPTLPQVVVATTAMLTFISFWRAAAIVLNDLASSAYYAGGIAEQAIGKTAPWFILAIMLFSYAVRAVYIESCSMFVRGGVYRVVKEAMGGTVAKISVSALMFDYILTGPISGVSAGQYLTGFLNELFHYARLNLHLPQDLTAAIFAALITLYFRRANIKGIPEGSEKALRIMYITTIMVVILIVWCTCTLWLKGANLPPWPLPRNLQFSPEALGWLRGSRLPYTIGLLGIFIALGHSILAMSGEETLAQVYREIEHPKLKNLKRAGLVIFIYSLVFTSLVSFFAVMIIPDRVRASFFDNLIGGLTMHLAGPMMLRIIFHFFVVFVGVLILAGAANTAIVGSNGVLNRVSEDGVLPDWFRHPHPRYGTTYRFINLVALLQLLTIFLSRGHVYLLGEAYAFGVLWSFVLNSLAVLVLRYAKPGPREFRVPLNFRVGRIEIPFGLTLITLVLLGIAATNLLTKEVATISGLAFSVFLFTVFTVSEKLTRRQGTQHPDIDQFQLTPQSSLTAEALGCRPGGVLVPVGNYYALAHVAAVLREVNTEQQDIVVLHFRVLERSPSGEADLAPDQLVASVEQLLFTKVLALAESEGKPVRLAAAATNDLWTGIVSAAATLQSRTIVLGKSSRLPVHEQARMIGLAWERLLQPRPKLTLEIYVSSREKHFFFLGPHSPDLTPAEVELLHNLWLKLSQELKDEELHHHDVVHFALQELERELKAGETDKVLQRLRQHLSERRKKLPS